MASISSFSSILAISLASPRRCRGKNLAVSPSPSQFLTCISVLKLKKQIFPTTIRFNNFKSPRTRARPVVFASQSNFFRVLQTAWKIGKDGIEAGTSLVPDSIPRPIARISVTVVALTLALFVLKSFLSTVFFVLAMMGLIYFTFIALNKDEGPKVDQGTTSTEDSLEEARRIMEKYK
ncbi:hypothetical protein M9H77_01234 [Catharanthus roseus]|uniref:Uncharacterized protein n=1 Tax=Catharanthus roseus TaxID=4058 RepID=A0ACC0C582_CATRO|nr:hypothetical protein M9H77_01234 [Catharanthus roseus]